MYDFSKFPRNPEGDRALLQWAEDQISIPYELAKALEQECQRRSTYIELYRIARRHQTTLLEGYRR